MSNDDTHIELTRRKILAGLGGFGLASAGAGLGTSAFLNDEERFESNAITAGELDLKVDWEEHYSHPQQYGFGDPSENLDVTRAEPGDTTDYVGLPDPDDPVVWANSADDPNGDGSSLDQYMSNTAIEAFPDPDDDGEQEVDVAGEFSYNPCDDGADLPEGLDSDLRTDNAATDPGDPLVKLDDVKPGDFGEFTFSFHLCDNPGYVWLQAANFSESEGAETEPEQGVDDDTSPELAENIRTVWWYDARGDNVPPRTDCEEKLYLSESGTDPTTLYEVELDDSTMEATLTELLGPGDYGGGGNFDQTDAIAATPYGDKVVFYDKSGRLGEYDVNNDSFTDLGSVSGDPGTVVLAGYSPSGTLWAADQDTNELYTVDKSAPSVTSQGDTGIDLSGADLAFSSDETLYIWTSEQSQNGLYKVDDPASDTTAVALDSSSVGNLDTDVTGIAIRDAGKGNIVASDNGNVDGEDEVLIVDRTDGSIADRYDMTLGGSDYDHVYGDMTSGQLCGEVFRRGNPEMEGAPANLKDDITELQQSPVPLDGNLATEFEEFNDAGADAARECFPAGVTHYIGFGWWVPEDVGNEIQGDSVSFDLGFYTEQCRNNDGSGP